MEEYRKFMDDHAVPEKVCFWDCGFCSGGGVGGLCDFGAFGIYFLEWL